ncbi:cytochrome P450 [Crucibulum laeve]|uniref:Cytochrome P450 n=1 Tax=Crucibulum laeve TaxID=68775 RepID=A0A5C3LPH2_9AGAR|nr:cytochrome P450 [Crucibulum laeve]
MSSLSLSASLEAYLGSVHSKQLVLVEYWWLALGCLVFAFVQYLLAVPAELRHLPKVSPYATIWSYARRESVDMRVKRLVLPFAQRGEGVVLVYMLGKWGIHVLDANLVKTVCQDLDRFPKKNYQDHLHFTFLSGPNVVFSNGEMWKRHSASVKAAFDREIPVHRFVSLSHELFERMGSGGIHRFSDLVQRYTLDVVGTALLGHNFQALQASEDSFVDHFNRVMSKIATPTRLIFPFLDDWFPRQAVIADVNSLNARYDMLLQMKKQDLGLDLLSYLLEDTTMTNEELRSNLAILFSAGHDTTSGALSTAIYHLAQHPEHQATAREEVLSVLGNRVEPTFDDLGRLPFLSACIKEALRINSPISLLPARWTLEPVQLGKYFIPAGVSVVPNVCAVHHNEKNWTDPSKFDPYRFIDNKVRAIANIPFGTGPRQCVARQFSLYEQRTLLCMLLKYYEWSLPSDSMHADYVKNEFGAFGLSIPHDLDVEFSKIN